MEGKMETTISYRVVYGLYIIDSGFSSLLCSWRMGMPCVSLSEAGVQCANDPKP